MFHPQLSCSILGHKDQSNNESQHDIKNNTLHMTQTIENLIHGTCSSRTYNRAHLILQNGFMYTSKDSRI